MNRGVPPTARNARTGEFTPPGVTARARSNRTAEAGASSGYGRRGVGSAAGASTAGLELTEPVLQARLCIARSALTPRGSATRLPASRPAEGFADLPQRHAQG